MYSLNFSTLMFLTILFLFVFVEKVTSSEEYTYESYQTSLQCTASSPIQYPTSITELQKIISDAAKSGKTVKAFGSRHSVTDIICTSEIPISFKNFNEMVLNLGSNPTVTVGAGAELLDLLNFLHKVNRTLITLPSSLGITVGGVIGTGAHGSSLRHPTALSDLVVDMIIVDGLGEVRKISDPEELRAFRVHLGLLGALVNVTLRTVPLFKMHVHNYEADEEILTDGTALQMARARDWFQIWWFPFWKKVIISEGNYTSDEPEGNAETNFVPNLNPAVILGGRLAFENMQATRNYLAQFAFEQYSMLSLNKIVVGKPPIFTDNGKYVNPAVGWAYRLQGNKCTNKCSWQNGEDGSVFPEDYLVEAEVSHLPQIIAKIKDILNTVPASFFLVGIFIRFSRKSDAFLSMSEGRDSVAIEWPTPMRVNPFQTARCGLAAYQAMGQSLVRDFDGRPHWAKNGQDYLTCNIVNKRPADKIKAFLNTREKYDPAGTFNNTFWKRAFMCKNVVTEPPEVKHCALQDFCRCSADSNCADAQTCDDKFLEKYQVCKDSSPPPSLDSILAELTSYEGQYNPLDFFDIIRFFLPGVLSELEKITGPVSNLVV